MDFKQLVMNGADTKYQEMSKGTTDKPLAQTPTISSNSTYEKKRNDYYQRLNREHSEFNKAVNQIVKTRIAREDKRRNYINNLKSERLALIYNIENSQKEIKEKKGKKRKELKEPTGCIGAYFKTSWRVTFLFIGILFFNQLFIQKNFDAGIIGPSVIWCIIAVVIAVVSTKGYLEKKAEIKNLKSAIANNKKRIAEIDRQLEDLQ